MERIKKILKELKIPKTGIVGEIDALESWMEIPVDMEASQRADLQNEILTEISLFTHIGFHGRQTIVRTPEGRCMISKMGDLLEFDFIYRDSKERLVFKRTESELDDWDSGLNLMQWLSNAPKRKQRDFSLILCNR